MSEWAPERIVDPSGAAALIAEQHPDQAPHRIELLAAGWDNTVFRVDEDWVYRFPRRAIAVPGVAREIAVLPSLARHLSLPVPVPEVVGVPSERFGWPWWGSRALNGVELADAGRPSDADRLTGAAQVGALLRELHSVDVAALGATGPAALPVDANRRADVRHRTGMLRERMARLETRGLWVTADLDGPMARRLAALLEECDAAADRPWPGSAPLVLVHGDLHLRHLLVDPDRDEITGVIDWGDLCLSDPGVDLAVAYCAFGGGARAALFAAYGPISAASELRARLLGLFLSLALLEYAADEGMTALEAECRSAARRALTD